jgi:hypothetical protein
MGGSDRAASVRGAAYREEFLIPIGYLWTIAAVSWGVACALPRWPRLDSLAAIPADQVPPIWLIRVMNPRRSTCQRGSTGRQARDRRTSSREG